MVEMTKRPIVEKQIILAVSGILVVLLSIGASLSAWSGEEVRRIVKDQFNAEQLVIARSVKSLIERELNLLKREIHLLSLEADGEGFSPEAMQRPIQMSFSRMMESGVRRIEIYNLEKDCLYVYMPYRQWIVAQKDVSLPDDTILAQAFSQDQAWISPPVLDGAEIYLPSFRERNGIAYFFPDKCLLVFSPFHQAHPVWPDRICLGHRRTRPLSLSPGCFLYRQERLQGP